MTSICITRLAICRTGKGIENQPRPGSHGQGKTLKKIRVIFRPMQALDNNPHRIGSFRRPILEILSDFSKPIPSRFIKKKPVFSRRNGQLVKTGEVDYVSWSTYIKLLEYYAPGYDWEIRVQYLGDRTVVEGRLTIRAIEGDFVREATGQEESDVDGYGDPCSNAEASALRRCCAKFGLGLHLWEN
jgi:hypothetical protein